MLAYRLYLFDKNINREKILDAIEQPGGLVVDFTYYDIPFMRALNLESISSGLIHCVFYAYDNRKYCVPVQVWNSLSGIDKRVEIKDIDRIEQESVTIETKGTEWTVIDADRPSPPQSKTADEYLDLVKYTMAARAKEYDKDKIQERSMPAAVAAFNAIKQSEILNVEDGYLLMQLVKAVRLHTNPENYHEDSAIDKIAFAALEAESWSKSFHQKGE